MLFDEKAALDRQSQASTKMVENIGMKQSKREKQKVDYRKHIEYLQEGSDYLGCVVSWGEGRHLTCLSNAKNIKINIRSISKLMSELAYLFLFLSNQKQIVFMNLQYVVSNHRSSEQDLSIIMVTQQQFENENTEMKQFIYNNYKPLSSDMTEGDFIKLYDEMVDKMFVGLRVAFQKQMFDINMPIFQIGKKQLEQFIYVITLMVKPNLKNIKNLSLLIIILEETQIFRQYSLNLKFCNSSVLVKAYEQQQFKQKSLLFFREYEKQLQKHAGNKNYKLNFKPVLQKYFQYLGKVEILKILDREKELIEKPYLRHSLEFLMMKSKEQPIQPINETSKQQNAGTQQQVVSNLLVVALTNAKIKPVNEPIVFKIYTEEKPYELMMAPKLQLILSEQKEIKPMNPQSKKPVIIMEILLFLPWDFTIRLESRYVIKRDQQQNLNSWINKLSHLNENVKISLTIGKGNQYSVITFQQKTILHIKDNFFILILKSIDELISIAQVLEQDIKFRTFPSDQKLQKMSKQIFYLHSKIHSILQQIMNS